MKSTKNLLSGPQFFQFLIFVSIIVLTVRSIEKNLQNFGIEFIVCMDCFLVQLIFIYVECHFASKIMGKSTRLAGIIYNFRWYELPLKQQRLVIPIIRQGQIPFTLDGYGFFSCTLETFAQVFLHFSNLNLSNINKYNSYSIHFVQLMQSSLSYYLVLRQLSWRKWKRKWFQSTWNNTHRNRRLRYFVTSKKKSRKFKKIFVCNFLMNQGIEISQLLLLFLYKLVTAFMEIKLFSSDNRSFFGFIW